MKEFAILRAKTSSYLTDNNDKTKKEKHTEKCAIKRKLKSEGYKNCLETSQLENKLHQQKKSKVDVDSLRENNKEFIKNNKLILILIETLICT